VTDEIKLHDDEPEKVAPAVPAAVKPAYRSPLLLISSAVTALVAWAALMWIDGFAALGLGVLSVLLGAFGMRGCSRGWRNLGVTAIICSTVLIVVVAAFLIVVKIGLS